jgi:PAS domain S-box-containing protein
MLLVAGKTSDNTDVTVYRPADLIGFTGRMLLFLLLLLAGTSEAQEEQTNHILILNSYHKEFQWTDDQTSAIKEVLISSIDNLELYIEYMDTKRIYTPEYLEHLLHIFHLKYDKVKFDAVVATDDNALRFIMEHHEEVFSGASVSFCGINGYRPGMFEGSDAFTGLIEVLDIKATVDLAMNLHDGIKTVYVITDNTPTGIGQQKDVKEVSKQYTDLNFEYFSGQEYSHSELLAKLRTLPKDSIVLLTVWLRDKINAYIPVDEGGPEISSASTVPVYGIITMYLEHGIVGGKLLSSQAQGSNAAKLMLRVFAGEIPSDIGVITESVNPYMFDHAELNRWNIDNSSLPTNSVIVNKPTTFYYRYYKIIWAVITIVILESFLIIALLVSIVSRKRAEQALRRSEKKHRELIENLPQRIFHKDINSVYVACNKHYAEDLGIDVDDIVGKTDFNFYPNDLAEKYRTDDRRVMDSGQVEEIEESYLKDGQELFIHTTKKPLTDDAGNVTGILGIFWDITERKQIEQEREQLVKTLEFKNKELQDVVYTASHDLRSPLVNIQGFSGELEADCNRLLKLLDKAAVDPELKEQIEPLAKEAIPESLGFIFGSANKMAGLLDGLLRVSRVGTAKINRKPIDANNTMSEVLAAMEYQIKENCVAISVGTLPGCIGDVNMVDQVFTNLIGNAIKYRDPAKKCEIRVSGKVEDAMSIYCVEDNGIGISPKHQGKVFEIFHRLDPNDSAGGEGLGLTIVTRIIDRLGGDIWIESEPDEGSKFFFALPTA